MFDDSNLKASCFIGFGRIQCSISIIVFIGSQCCQHCFLHLFENWYLLHLDLVTLLVTCMCEILYFKRTTKVSSYCSLKDNVAEVPFSSILQSHYKSAMVLHLLLLAVVVMTILVRCNHNLGLCQGCVTAVHSQVRLKKWTLHVCFFDFYSYK